MYTDSEGIVLKQTKTVGGRRMILLFSRKFGKISAGTSISEKGRGKAALAMRPFTYGRYELFRTRDNFNIQSAEVLRSYYKLGEDVDKYMAASYILELTDKVLAEGAPNPSCFLLLLDIFDLLEKRDKDVMTPVLAFEAKLLRILGVAPELRRCVRCGAPADEGFLHLGEGGLVCGECCGNLNGEAKDSLIYEVNFDIIEILRYFFDNPVLSFQNLSLDPVRRNLVQQLLRQYMACHLELGELKSEHYMNS